MIRQQKLREFHLDPLLAHMDEVRRDLSDGLVRLILDHKVQLCRKPHCPENPQRVLRKPVLRTADAPDHPALQVFHALKLIHDPRLMAVCHGIDRKVPAL